MTCDGRLFHRRAAATGNALSPTVDRRVRRTSRDVDEAERSRRLDSVSAGRRSSSHRYVDILDAKTATCSNRSALERLPNRAYKPNLIENQTTSKAKCVCALM